jgi:hypothetical protein
VGELCRRSPRVAFSKQSVEVERSGSNGFLDPNLKNVYSDQYNVGFQRSFGNNSVFTVNYVGSRNHREQLQTTGNTALTPGPGDPQLRAPFPYIQPQNGYARSVGKSNYNALQVSSEGRSIRGLSYKLAYTYSKVINFGGDMYGSFCGSTIRRAGSH